MKVKNIYTNKIEEVIETKHVCFESESDLIAVWVFSDGHRVNVNYWKDYIILEDDNNVQS